MVLPLPDCGAPSTKSNCTDSVRISDDKQVVTKKLPVRYLAHGIHDDVSKKATEEKEHVI